MKYVFALVLIIFLGSCYQPERNCTDFKEGAFTYTTIIKGKEETTTFVRSDTLEIATFEGKIDSAAVRWINDCEYVVRNLNPKSMREEKAIHMKILTTTDNSYTFEFGVVGSSEKAKGTAIRKTN